MRRQRATRLARLVVATGLPPSELRHMTGHEVAALLQLHSDMREP